LDNLSQGRSEWLPNHPNLEFLHADICDAHVCNKACDDIDGVFHLAAMSKVAPSLSDPIMVDFCTQQNVLGTINILNASRIAGVRQLVYAASSTVYGKGPTPNQEDAKPDC